MVAEARLLDNIGQQVAVACRGDQQVQDVVAACGRGDVLRQVVPLQQVVNSILETQVKDHSVNWLNCVKDWRIQLIN